MYDSKTNQPMETSILVERLPDGRKVGEMNTNERGEFSFKLRPGAKYGMVARQEGYLALSENFDFNDVIRHPLVSKIVEAYKK